MLKDGQTIPITIEYTTLKDYSYWNENDKKIIAGINKRSDADKIWDAIDETVNGWGEDGDPIYKDDVHFDNGILDTLEDFYEIYLIEPIDAQIKELIKYGKELAAVKLIKDTYGNKYQFGLKWARLIYDVTKDYDADVDRLVTDEDYFEPYFKKYFSE